MNKNFIRKIKWILNQQLGIDPIRLARSPIGLYRYLKDLLRFKRHHSGNIKLMPCLHDWWEPAGALKNEYFWQDLFVAKLIYIENPIKHIDIGSRIDGFVAHLATFREVEVFDVRPLYITIPGIDFKQADLMNAAKLPSSYCDSISCLHAIEHFGLGRYGDPIDPNGLEKGIGSISQILSVKGKLYLSCPAGNDVIQFNAHRSMRPSTIIAIAQGVNLEFLKGWLFDSISYRFMPIENDSESNVEDRYTLGIYIFDKK